MKKLQKQLDNIKNKDQKIQPPYMRLLTLTMIGKIKECIMIWLAKLFGDYFVGIEISSTKDKSVRTDGRMYRGKLYITKVKVEENLMIPCKVCGKASVYYESSPDGEPNFFCTKKHHVQYREERKKKGFAWRANPLATPIPEYYYKKQK